MSLAPPPPAPSPPVPSPTTAAPAPTPAGAAPPTRGAGALRGAFADTPGRLRILTALVVVVTIAFGLLAAQAFRATSQALERADANTAQLLRVQAVAVDLARADATATNSFLVGGLEPAAQRTEYLAAMDEATALIARAATAQPADAEALARLNTLVSRYAGTIEQARANNRQNLQVGAQYLRVASASLRGEALPILDALATANTERVDLEVDAAAGSALLLDLMGVLTLLVLLGGGLWLALRTHRYLNVGVVVAAVLVLATLVVASVALNGVQSGVDDVRTGALETTIDLGTARVAAFDARSNESLTLVARGSGQAFEAAWVEAAGTVTSSAPQLRGDWTPYAQAHTQIRELDDGGRWEQAVVAATDEDAASAQSFAAFDEQSRSALDAASQEASSGLRSALGWLPFAGWVALVAGVAAAVAGWRGITERLEEYR